MSDPLVKFLSDLYAHPAFTQEGPQFYAQAHAINAPYAKPGPYQSRLSPMQEIAFRLWAGKNGVPVTPDYDMRGFWLATHGAPHQQGTHFPDTFKTPLDTSFSNQSKYATKDNPFAWRGNTLVNTQTGTKEYGSVSDRTPVVRPPHPTPSVIAHGRR